jgi:uncharacterized protein (TIGR02391 family)
MTQRGLADIRRAIGRLDEHVVALEAIASEGLAIGDERVDREYRELDKTIVGAFDEESDERREYSKHRNAHWPFDSATARSLYQYHEFRSGIAKTISLIGYLQAQLKRRAEEKQREILRDADVHPRIAEACINHFENGEYRSAVLDACLALNRLVQDKSGRPDLDGAKLMWKVFSPDEKVLVINELADESDISEQNGVMHLLAGAMLALRNPRAHALDPDAFEGALDRIMLLSLLATWVDTAKRVSRVSEIPQRRTT